MLLERQSPNPESGTQRHHHRELSGSQTDLWQAQQTRRPRNWRLGRRCLSLLFPLLAACRRAQCRVRGWLRRQVCQEARQACSVVSQGLCKSRFNACHCRIGCCACSTHLASAVRQSSTTCCRCAAALWLLPPLPPVATAAAVQPPPPPVESVLSKRERGAWSKRRRLPKTKRR
jgi:hypothetical protein